jgi:hypothetical protein
MPNGFWNIGWRGAGVAAAVWCATVATALVAAQDSTPADAAPQPDAQTAGANTAEGEPAALVKQLGDPDFKVREAAAKRLKDLGRDALPALTEALAQGKDPEVCSRADALMRRIQRPAIPGDWLGAAGPRGLGGGGFDGAAGLALRGFAATQVRTSIVNGRRVVEVNAGPQRRLTISEGPTGIDMTVTGFEDGEPVTARFRARSVEELQENDPDAFAIYQQWAGNGRAGVMRGRRLLVPDVPMPLPVPMQVPQLPPRAQFRAGVGVGGMPMPVPLLRQPADDLAGLTDRVEQQMRQSNVPDEQQRAVRDLLGELQKMQLEGRAAQPAEVDRQVQRYNALSDALRDKLSALKLPDPGDSLPPPAKSRLGISGAAPGVDALIAPGNAAAGGVLVNRVQADSRGARLGLLEGDLIQTLNGKPVPNVLALRRMVTEAKEPLVLQVTRDGKPLVLKEKAAGGQ